MSNSKVAIPWWGKLLLVTAGISAVVIGIIYLLSMASTVRWERYAASLREGGQPLTFDEIEEKRKKIPDEMNGAMLLEDLANDLKAISTLGSATSRSVLVFGRDKNRCNLYEGIPRYRLDASRACLNEHRDLLIKLRSMHDRPSGRMDCTLAPIVALTDINPNMAAASVAGKLVYLNSIVATVDGDVARAIDSTRVLAHISGSLNQYPRILGQVTQDVIDITISRAVGYILRTTELDKTALLKLTVIIDQRLDDRTMKWALLGERAHFLAICEDVLAGRLTLAQIIADNANGPAFPNAPSYIIRENQTVGVELLTRLIAAIDDPQALMKAANELDAEISSLSKSKFLVKMFVQSFSGAITFYQRNTAELQCARLGLVAERFRMTTGRLPVSLDKLVPDYVDEIPTDPFDGEPMRFAETEKGIVIYSIDENLVDDGGMVEHQIEMPHVRDSGFRLFKPEHRGVLLSDEPPPEDD